VVAEVVYTVEEVAGLLKVAPQTVRRYLVAGKMKGFKIGKDWRITESDLQTFVEGARPEPGDADTDGC